MQSRISLILLVVVLPALIGSVDAQNIAYSVQSNGNDNLYQIDLTTGMATSLGLVGLNDAEGMASIGSTIYAIGGTIDELWDITSPPGTMIGPTGPRNGVDAGLAYDNGNGILYNLQGSGSLSELYTIDVTTGAATLVGTSTNFSDGLAIDLAGNAYGTDFIFQDGLFSVDLTTGATTFIGPFNVGLVSLQAGASFDANGILWALASNGALYTIDVSTGTATLTGMVVDAATGAALAGFEGFDIPGGGGTPPCQLLASGNPGTGGGTLVLTSVPMTVTQGFTLFSLNTAGPAGQGPLLGLYPDAFTNAAIAYGLGTPAAAGDPLHWTNTPGVWPNAPFQIPLATFAPNTVIDFLCLKVDVTGVIITNIARGTF
ncbi:MAG: hypothetical protein CMJ83_06390 [Planctomycetes bacterium]|nr:hypothetical protein [Planctomycetota bacterium]